MKKKVLGVILCRSNSKRLKNKLKLKFGKKNIFEYFYNRLSLCKNIDEFIISTTKDKKDNYFQNFAERNYLHIYRGSQNNIFARIKNSIEHMDENFDIMIRCNADNPLIMPDIIDEDINFFKASNCDFFSPFHKNKIPFGYSFYIFKTKTFLKVSKMKLTKKYSEHVDNYFIENKTKFKVLSRYNKKFFCPNLFLTLDTKFDLTRIEYFAKKIEKIPIRNQPLKLISVYRKLK